MGKGGAKYREERKLDECALTHPAPCPPATRTVRTADS